MNRKINQAGQDLVKLFEGIKLKPYLDSGGVPTIGIGSTEYEDGRKVTLKDNAITNERAEQLLTHFLTKFCKTVEEGVIVDITDNQFSALVVFCYNVGSSAFLKSTLLKKLNKYDVEGASNEFLRWDKDNGVVVKGLTRRRKAERDLFLTVSP